MQNFKIKGVMKNILHFETLLLSVWMTKVWFDLKIQKDLHIHLCLVTHLSCHRSHFEQNNLGQSGICTLHSLQKSVQTFLYEK